MIRENGLIESCSAAEPLNNSFIQKWAHPSKDKGRVSVFVVFSSSFTIKNILLFDPKLKIIYNEVIDTKEFF